MRLGPFPLFIWYLILVGCDNATVPATDPNVRISMSGCLAARKPSSDTLMQAGATYIGKDSLDFIVPSLLFQCQSEYAFSYPSLIDAETIAIHFERVRNSGAKCLCEKDVRFGIKSKGEDFSAVKKVSVGTREYGLALKTGP